MSFPIYFSDPPPPPIHKHLTDAPGVFCNEVNPSPPGVEGLLGVDGRESTSSGVYPETNMINISWLCTVGKRVKLLELPDIKTF